MSSAHCTKRVDASLPFAASPLASARSLIKQVGVRSLWRGFGPVTLRALPSSGSAMLVYEWAKTLATGNRAI
jgi:hypothetical protein